MGAKKASFLIAMPSLTDGIFTKSLILMANMGKDGALGFMLNHETGATLKEAAKLMSFESEKYDDMSILLGGPVQTDFFWAIHSKEVRVANTVIDHPLFAVSPALELLTKKEKDPTYTIYYLGVGYAGWGEGQLEKEIEEGAWWKEEIDWEEIYATPNPAKWHGAFKLMGIESDEMVDPTNPFAPPTIN